MSRTPSPAPLRTPNTPRPPRSVRRSRSVSPGARRRLVTDESPRTPVRGSSSRQAPNAPPRQPALSRLSNAPPSLLRSATASQAELFFFLQRLPVVVVIDGQPVDRSWEEERVAPVTPVTPPSRRGRPQTPGAPKRARSE